MRNALLGLRADAPNRCLYVEPRLPVWLPDITLYRLAVGDARLDLHVWRENDETRWDVLALHGKLSVEEKPWEPWPVEQEPVGRERAA